MKRFEEFVNESNLRLEIITPFLKEKEIWIPTLYDYNGWESTSPPTKEQTTQRVLITKVFKYKIEYELHIKYNHKTEITQHSDKIKDFLIEYNPIEHTSL